MEDGNSNGMNMIGFGAAATTNNNNNNDGNVSNSMELMMMVNGRRAHRHFPLSNTTNNNSATSTVSSSLNMLKEVNNSSASPSCFMENNSMMLRAKILSHPHFPRLLAAYTNCQKVGAPPQVVERLEQACGGDCGGGNIGEDPALDQFMEAYCEMLIKYEEELSKPIKEAMFFLSRIQYQLNALTSLSSLNNNSSPVYGDFTNRTGSSEGEVDATTDTVIDPQAEDKELKGQLLRRYGGHLGSLNQEFLKKKKKGKLPKEARQLLLDWWRTHYKWPYPSESQKVALAEATSLDQKQINNWFINQRKRHWKPTDDSMPCVAMDGTYAHYYLENVNMGSAVPMDYAPPGY